VKEWDHSKHLLKRHKKGWRTAPMSKKIITFLIDYKSKLHSPKIDVLATTRIRWRAVQHSRELETSPQPAGTSLLASKNAQSKIVGRVKSKKELNYFEGMACEKTGTCGFCTFDQA